MQSLITTRLSVLSAIFLLFTAFSCNEDDPLEISPCGTEVTLRDMSGLSNCGWMFQLPNGDRLQPVQYMGDSFTIEDLENAASAALYDGKTVTIDYEVLPNMQSNCMAGAIVNITCITDAGNSED